MRSSAPPSPLRPQDDSRRSKILALLAGQGSMTVAELVDSLGVTATAVRQQLTPLVVAGLLVRTQRRRGPGRPEGVFSLSDKARRLFAHEVGGLAHLLLREIVETDGPAKLRSMLRGISDRLLEQWAPLVGGRAPNERVERLTDLLRQRGIVSDASSQEGTLRLNVRTCPYHGLPGDYPQICEMERDTYSRLLDRPVNLKRCIRDGSTCCEFEMSAATETPDAG